LITVESHNCTTFPEMVEGKIYTKPQKARKPEKHWEKNIGFLKMFPTEPNINKYLTLVV